MKRPVRRLLVTFVALVCLTFGSSVPASAGTLTGATFTAPAGWTTTGASNARYDWGFTTATSGTLSKVTASVPSGTGGKNRYLALPGIDGNWAVNNDSSPNVPDDLDLRIKVARDSWRTDPGYTANLIRKNGTYGFKLTGNGYLEFVYNTPSAFVASTAGVPFNAGTYWLRVTVDVDNGSGGKTITFYTSVDGTTWNQLGWPRVDTTTGTSPLPSYGSPLGVGASSGYQSAAGSYYYAEVRNGINGPVVNKFDPNEAAAQSPSSWTSSTGETWTVNRSGTNMPADIATDLSVGPVEGLPSGGTANYRFIDGVATYNLPTATSVNAGTSVKLNLGGFTNTATPGSYTSTIRTYDNASTPVVVDSATTSALSFAPSNNSSTAVVSVDPTLTLTLSGRSGLCNGVMPTPGSSSSGSSVSLGRISATSGGIASQDIAVSTNANSGFVLQGRYARPLTTSGGGTINDAPQDLWSNASSFPALGTSAFGFGMDWYSGDDVWVRFTQTNKSNFRSSTYPTSSSQCIAYRAQAGANTPAGVYSTSITYTISANY